MTNLPALLSKQLEFSDRIALKASLDDYPNNTDYYYCDETFVAGARWQHAQTAPLVQALLDAVEALELVKELTDLQDVYDALAKLNQFVEGKGE